ncbi:helix-turn-helix transcriptional regulator [Streptomyces buecherae]|uniref:helix-turn-helix domain-containing protein n=1 Tax=Streptomyces buecherae TaxID=2763006 RepID=UPI0033DA50EA
MPRRARMPYSNVPTSLLTNGQRLARIRDRRRWTQTRLSTESGYSLSAVKKFEQGRRSLDRADVILRFARALDCHPTEITGQPYSPPDGDLDGHSAVLSIAAIRRALLRHGRPSRPSEQEVAGVDMEDLRARVAEANGYRQKSALVSSGKVLPALLRDLQVAVDVAPEADRRQAHDLLASAYECAMQMLYKLGRGADATLATERVVWSTTETGDPLRALSGHWYESGEFLAIGEHEEAGAIIDGALTELDRCATSPEQVSLKGAFHLKASLNHARASEPKSAEKHLALAGKLAETLGGDRNDFQLQFGPTNVAIWSVSLPVEVGQGREAVRRAAQVTPRLPAHYARERRSHHFIDVGRAHHYNGRNDEALESFLHAERLAPQATRMHPAVHETMNVILNSRRRTDAYEFALRLGLL